MFPTLPLKSLVSSSKGNSEPAAVRESFAGEEQTAHSRLNGDETWPPESRESRRFTFRRAFSALFDAAAWCGVFALAVFALLRIFFHDGTPVLTCINAFTLYVYLPAYAALAWAIWRKRWVLAAASGFAVLCHAFWVAPDFTPARPIETSAAVAAASPPVKIFYANISAFNPEPDGIFQEVQRQDPDVIVFVEYQRWWHQQMMSSPFISRYDYGTGITQKYLGEIAFFSKLPITNVERHWPGGRQVCVVDFKIGAVPLRLLALHSPRPMPSSGDDYAMFWSHAIPMIEADTAPLIVVGDFNATQHSKVYRTLTAGDLHSAHAERGRGYAITWPNGKFIAPPIRIDHALLSPAVECLKIREGNGQGSDHKPLIFTVRVRP